MDETEIRSFFTRYGSVKEVKIITDRTGVSKGYVNIFAIATVYRTEHGWRDAWISDKTQSGHSNINKICSF